MEKMTHDEMVNNAIDTYVMLQRIKKSQPIDVTNLELDYLIRVYEIKLANFSVNVDTLKL